MNRRGATSAEYLLLTVVIAAIGLPLLDKHFGGKILGSLQGERGRLVRFISQDKKARVPSRWYAVPETPSDPDNPADPGNPQEPAPPGNPASPTDPENPATPNAPGNPAGPSSPGNPGVPTAPNLPGNPGGGLDPTRRVSTPSGTSPGGTSGGNDTFTGFDGARDASSPSVDASPSRRDASTTGIASADPIGDEIEKSDAAAKARAAIMTEEDRAQPNAAVKLRGNLPPEIAANEDPHSRKKCRWCWLRWLILLLIVLLTLWIVFSNLRRPR